MSNIRIMLYQEGNHSDFLPALVALKEVAVSFDLTVLCVQSRMDELASQCEAFCKTPGFRKITPDFQPLEQPDLWPEAASRLANAAPADAYTFLLANSAQIAPDALGACHAALERNKILQGASPVLMDSDTGRITHLGTVADNVGNLHYLYEGISRQNPLAHKQRAFQFAHPAAVLLRNSAIQAVGGFKPQLDDIFFLSFCASLAREFGPCFAVVPDAVAVWQRQPLDLLAQGVWNSYAALGKIPAGVIEPDFYKHAAEDDLEYNVSQWLREDVVNNWLWDEEDPWLAWRHTGSPLMLMRWLGSLDDVALQETLRIIQSCPHYLPKQLRYYEVLARRLSTFAAEHDLHAMQANIADWQKRARYFHYRELAPAMRLMQKAGIYHASLDRCAATYDAWLELSPNARAQRIDVGAHWPKIAVAMPVYNPDPRFLREAIQSVQRQTYVDWQLCIADDASSNPDVRNILTAFAREDGRIKINFRQQNGHICAATNSAIAIVDAPFIAFMDHDDMLAPDALASVAKEIAQDGNLKLIYTDLDHIDVDNVRSFPFFKPDYNAELDGSSHLSVYAANILRKVGLFRSGTEGSQDQDIYLRVTESCESAQIKHIPRVLYHWRVHAGSVTTGIGVKPYVLAATEKLQNDMAKRRGIRARAVELGARHWFSLFYEPRPELSCAIVVLEQTKHIADSLLVSLQNVAEHCKCSFYILPLGAGNAHGASSIELPNWRRLPFECENWPQACNTAAQSLDEDIILFISSTLRPLPGCHPEQLVLHAALPRKGLVGSMLWRCGCLINGGYYPNIDGKPFALMRGMGKSDLSVCCYGCFTLPHAVIGMDWRAFAVARQTLLAAGSFDAELGSWANIDFCLRLAKQGFSNLVSPFGQWELAALPPNETPEAEKNRTIFLERWQEGIVANGLRNPNLEAACDNDWRLRF